MQPTKKLPDITQAFADQLSQTALVQLRTSRQYKAPRMKDIAESEDLYFGIVKPTLRNPFNEPFPFMPGFVDTLVSKLDDPPEADIVENDEADYISAKRYQAAFNMEVESVLPHAKWALKDRWVRKQAIFSGVGVYSIYGEAYDGNFKCCFNGVDYYDFHCEPGGGGDLESHLFVGETSIFKTKEELLYGAKEGYYDEKQVADLIALGSQSDYKENSDAYNERLNRHRAMGLDPQSNNYTGQALFKFCQWILTYDNVRYYLFFEERTGKWVRIKMLREMFIPLASTGEALYPYVAWHTHEDQRVFWSKAPADDARPIARTINRLLNQELYNREKMNYDQRYYDPEMFYDVEALQSQQIDGLIPFNSNGGQRRASDGIYKVQTGEITGTINLVSFLDSFNGTKTGTTPGSQGDAPSDQKVGIYFGELKQIEGRLGLYNKSYKEAWAELVYRYIQAIDKNITKPMAIKMYGSDGLKWDELTPEDKNRVRDFGIKIKGGQDELAETQAKNDKKLAALQLLTSVSPRFKDEQIMKAAGFDDDDIRDAFSALPPASKELLAEAAQAVNDIERGLTPKLNPGANLTYMQKLIDEGNEEDDAVIAGKIYDFASAHALIVAQNEARTAGSIVAQKTTGMTPGNDSTTAPLAPPTDTATPPINASNPSPFTPSPMSKVTAPPGLESMKPTQSAILNG